jgi:hypothetical protein
MPWTGNVSNQAKSRNVDEADYSETYERKAHEELIFPIGEFGALFMSAVLVVRPFFVVIPLDRKKRARASRPTLLHLYLIVSVLQPLHRCMRERASPKDRRRRTYGRHVAGRRISIVFTRESHTSRTTSS